MHIIMSEIIRLIAAGLLALCACYIGVIIKQHYVEREKYYRSLCEFITVLSTELSYKKTPLTQIIQGFREGRKGEIVNTLDEFMSRRRKDESDNAIAEKMEIKHLKPAEKKEVLAFLGELGKSALDEQLAVVARAEKKFDMCRSKCAEESKKQGGMYFKLCVLLGLALIVILA